MSDSAHRRIPPTDSNRWREWEFFGMPRRQPMNDLGPETEESSDPIVEFICAHVIATARLSASCW
ncbi:hypothetical protein CN206_19680 [Sinorhizobium meliloti]|nr:hypothetical protein CN206_19680 [Sinorhizobium meliloti]